MEKSKKVYRSLQNLFLDLPVVNENYVVVDLDSIEREEYSRLYNCFMHIEEGEINIKKFDVENSKQIPINEGSFCHTPYKFKPSIFYKGLINGRRHFMMEHYNLDFSKLEVKNGLVENYVFYEEKGKELEVKYDGLNINKVTNKKIEDVEILSLEKVHIFISDFKDIDTLLYVSELVDQYSANFTEINIIYPKQDLEDLEYYKKKYFNHSSVTFIDISEVVNFNELIHSKELLIFNDLTMANAFTDYYTNNNVLIYIHENVNKMSTRDLALITRLNTIIESGEILFQASLNCLNKVLPSVTHKGTYIYKAANTKIIDNNASKVTIRCTEATTTDLVLVKKQLEKYESNVKIDILVNKESCEFVKSTLKDREYNFVDIADYSLEGTKVYINPSKFVKNDFLLWKAFEMGSLVVAANYQPYLKQMINSHLILDIEDAKLISKMNEVKKKITNVSRDYKFTNKYVLSKKPQGDFSQKVFVYNTKISGNQLQLKLFYRGYEKSKHEFLVNTRIPFTLVANDDFKYYSAPSVNYKENFKTLTLNMDDFRDNDYLEFICGEKILDIYLVHFGVNNIEYEDMLISIADKNRFMVSIENFENTSNKAKLFQDRCIKADDNAETLYDYCMAQKIEDCYFLIDRDVPDYTRLINKGFKVIEWGSDLHKDLFITGEAVFSSHISARIIIPFKQSDARMLKRESKTIFLQHGQLFEDHQYFLNSIKNPLDMICVSSKRENDFVKSFSDYENVVTTGLARHDRLMVLPEKEQNEILYFPTWNRMIDLDNVPESDYYKEITNLYKSKEVNEFCKENNLVLKVVFHMESQEYFDISYEQSNVKLFSQNEIVFSELIRDNLALITDVSSLMFDQAYLRKPIISYRPYSVHSFNPVINDISANPQNVQEVINCLETLKKNYWKTDDKYIEGMEQFFDFADQSNSERIMTAYNEMLTNE